MTETDGQDIDIYAWVHDVIEDMGTFEDREMVVWHVPDREAAACWIIRCLANPREEAAGKVLASIIKRREEAR